MLTGLLIAASTTGVFLCDAAVHEFEGKHIGWLKKSRFSTCSPQAVAAQACASHFGISDDAYGNQAVNAEFQYDEKMLRIFRFECAEPEKDTQ